MQNNINIVLSADNNFAKHLYVTICSILENKSIFTNITLYVIDGGISENIKKIINQTLKEKYNIQIKYLIININLYKDLSISDHISLATYYRLSIPDLLDIDIHKVLYLDCDIIITKDLSKLYNTDIDNYFLAAVSESLGYTRKKILGIPDNYDYFNAGVILINLKKWREESIGIKVIKYIKVNPEKILRWDQDGLNAILFDKRLGLDVDFNFQKTYKLQNIKHYKEIINNYRKGFNIPTIIHFSSGLKPRKYGGYHTMRREYFKYLQLSPWKLSYGKKIKYTIFDLGGLLYFTIKKYFKGLVYLFLRK